MKLVKRALITRSVDEAAAASSPLASAAIIPPPADWKADMESEITALKTEVAALRETVDRLAVLLD